MSGSKPGCGTSCTRCCLTRLRAAGEIEWSRAIVDAQPRAGEKRGSETGPSPVDRGRAGSKHHLLVDATGIPLACALTGGNRHDVTQLIPLLDRVPRRRRPCRPATPTTRPARSATAATTTTSTAGSSARAASRPVIARRQTEHGSGLGAVRWVVERTFAHLHQFKRLLVRYERRAEMHEAMLALGCCLDPPGLDGTATSFCNEFYQACRHRLTKPANSSGGRRIAVANQRTNMLRLQEAIQQLTGRVPPPAGLLTARSETEGT